LGLAQPCPQLTTPASVVLAPVPVSSGPPLSPWQESLPPFSKPAQIILSVMLPG